MKLISRVSCADEAFGCAYALIDLTQALARLALKRIGTLCDMKRVDHDLYETRYWDYQPVYFSPWAAEGEGCGDVLAEAIEQSSTVAGDWMEAPAGLEIPELLVTRIESPRMVVRDDGIFFVAILKHTDFTVSTGELPAGALEAASA
jgi:hypothetical protein